MTNYPTYADQKECKDIQSFLPKRLHFTPDHYPTEEVWHHRGHALHLDRWRNPSAEVRLIMHHGMGTNGRMMSMLLGVPLHEAGFELVAIDMPGYGCTVPAKNYVWDYNDWVKISSAFIDHEYEHDKRPIVLYGLSAGGGLTFHSAGLNGKVKGIIGMCFMDMRIQAVVDAACRNLVMSRIGVPSGGIMTKIGLGWLSMPMWLTGRMSALVNNQQALQVCYKDNTSANAWVTMKFLASFSSYKPAKEPVDFDVCPILLTQPAEDKWTPLWVSEAFLKDVTKVPVKKVMLEGAGHYPLEDPGLKQMIEAIVVFLKDVGAKS
jgi:alpha-beta hydrolase superfamily lysophospholipase